MESSLVLIYTYVCGDLFNFFLEISQDQTVTLLFLLVQKLSKFQFPAGKTEKNLQFKNKKKKTYYLLL